MRDRVCWAMGLFVLALHCATVAPPMPAPRRPLTGCHVTCVTGRSINRRAQDRPFFKVQKKCLDGASRMFEEVTIRRESPDKARWVTDQGDYDKDDVVLTSCESFIARAQSELSADQRGAVPGEDPFGHPKQ
jgi:hypothetical protein